MLNRNFKMIFANKYISIGELPLMTEKGTFIVNGKKRVLGVIQ